MKTDNYLNLCLDQATKSSLRYRHGAIVVCGGKVIGQGYNDYRSGFDGGALKSGRLPLRSSGGLAIDEFKKKNKPNLEPESEPETVIKSNKTSAPFESIVGGGKLANTALSMHSEMMAIQSALTAASSAVSSAATSKKNRASNYRVALNGNLDYDVRRSICMSRQSAKHHSPSRSKTAACLEFNSGALKAVYPDRTKSLVFQVEMMKENTSSSKENSTGKH
jgi:deoxycytidylate deaminase